MFSASLEFISLKKILSCSVSSCFRGFYVPDFERMRHFASTFSLCSYLGIHYPFRSFCYLVKWGLNMKSERLGSNLGCALEINSVSVSLCLKYDTL